MYKNKKVSVVIAAAGAGMAIFVQLHIVGADRGPQSNAATAKFITEPAVEADQCAAPGAAGVAFDGLAASLPGQRTAAGEIDHAV